MTTDQDDMLDELDEEPAYADAWIAENEGDTIIGEVVNVSERDGEYGRYTIVTILPDGQDTPLAVHCTGSVLSDQVAEDNPAKGDRYAVRFGGWRDGKNGRQYKAWRTAVRRGPFIAAEPTPAPKKSATTRQKAKTPESAPVVDGDGMTF